MAEDEGDQSRLEVLVEVVDQVTEPLSKIGEAFEDFESSIWDLTKAFSSIFLGYELLEHLTDPAREFQQAQVDLALATHATAEQLAEFKEQGEALSESWPKTLEDITAAQTNLYQTFRDFDIAKEGTGYATRLATILGVTAAQGANDLASAVQNLGDKGKSTTENMANLSDKIAILVTRFPSGPGGVGRLAMDLGRVGATARTFGITANQVFALMGELNRLHVGGVRGAGMFVQQLITEIAGLDSKGRPKLEKYGLQVVKTTEGHVNLLATIKRLTEMNPKALETLEQHLPGSGQALSALAAHWKDLEGAYTDFLHSSGAASEVARKKNETFDAKMEELHNTTRNFLEMLGTQMIPDLTKLIELLTRGAQAVDEFAKEHPELTRFITQLLELSGATLTLVATFGFLGKLVTFAVSGIADLVRMTGLVDALGAAWELLAGFIEGATLAGAEFGIGAFASAAIATGGLLLAVTAIAAISYEIYKHWDSIAGVIREAVDALHSFWSFGTAPGGLADKIWDLGLPAGSSDRSSAIESRQNAHTVLHYSPIISMQGGAEAQKSLESILSGHSEDLISKVAEQNRQQQRLTFKDTTLAHAQ